MNAKSKSGIATMFVAALFAGPVAAQSVAPWTRPADLLVADTGADVIYRLADSDLDGDYNDLGEVSTFFANGAQGVTIVLASAIAVGPDGSVYLSDTSTDLVHRLIDLNADGDAMDAGEVAVWFGSTGSTAPNASGMNVPSMFGIAVDVSGSVFVTNNGTAALPTDFIGKLVDLNGDGDAQDAGEAFIYTTTSTSAVGNNSVPTSVAVGPDGNVYYGESCAAGGVGRGVWRLVDTNADGDADDAGEKSIYYTPTGAGTASLVSFYGLAFDAAGRLFLTDHTTDNTYAATDLNGDFVVTAGGPEETVFFNPGSTSLSWSSAVGQDLNGNLVLMVVDDQAPERIHRLVDLNLDGDASDLGESGASYDETLGGQLLDSPRGITFMKGPSLAAGPLPAILGQNFNLVTSGGANEVFLVEIGLPLGFGAPVPPFGVLFLDLTPGTYFDLVPLFVLPPSGEALFSFPIPNFPPLLSLTFQIQGVGGSSGKLFFTNGITLTFI